MHYACFDCVHDFPIYLLSPSPTYSLIYFLTCKIASHILKDYIYPPKLKSLRNKKLTVKKKNPNKNEITEGTGRIFVSSGTIAQNIPPVAFSPFLIFITTNNPQPHSFKQLASFVPRASLKSSSKGETQDHSTFQICE